MKTYYTIISANIRAIIDERITIGLLIVHGDVAYFNYSKDKVNISKELLDFNAYKYLKETVKNISTEINNQNNTPIKVLNPLYTTGYLSYLKKYSNSVLSFSEPKFIDAEFNGVLLQNLFNKYIDNNSIEIIKKINNFDSVKESFYDKINTQFNIETELSPLQIPNLSLPIKIDLIGKNERVVYAQAIDLERGNYHILNDIGTIHSLNFAFENKAQSFIVSSEPNDKVKYASQHDIWKKLKENKFAEYIDVSEIDKIKEYADLHGVLPLLTQLQA